MIDATEQAAHVFICYARRDAEEAGALHAALEKAAFPVWIDTQRLEPGEEWATEIHRMIPRSSAFLACFSSRSVAARGPRFQNEEILQAVVHQRQLQPATQWLIPVRFDDCALHPYDLGANRTLASLQRADLFGGDRNQNLQSLLTTLDRLTPRDSATLTPASVIEEQDGEITLAADPDTGTWGTALLVKGSDQTFPVWAERMVGTPDWCPEHLASRVRAVRTSEALPGLERRGWDPGDPWSDTEARERARHYWPIARQRVLGWIEAPSTMPSELLMGIRSGAGKTVVRYVWTIDPEGVWDVGDGEGWVGVPLGRSLRNHPALGKALMQESGGKRYGALRGFAAGWRVVRAVWLNDPARVPQDASRSTT